MKASTRNKLGATLAASLIGSLSCQALAAPPGVEIGGDLHQKYTAVNSPQTAIAVGREAKASAHANVLEGGVRIGGNANQIYDAKNSPQTAIAVGSGAEAHVSANRVSGR